MANQISFKYRPSYHQVTKYNWDDASRNPYPGWKVAVRHTPSGWKVGIMTYSEYDEWDKEHSQPFNKAAQARQRELHPAEDDRSQADGDPDIQEHVAGKLTTEKNRRLHSRHQPLQNCHPQVASLLGSSMRSAKK